MAFSSVGAKLCEQLLPELVSLILEYAAYPVHPCTDQLLRLPRQPHLARCGAPLWMSRLRVTTWYYPTWYYNPAYPIQKDYSSIHQHYACVENSLTGHDFFTALQADNQAIDYVRWYVIETYIGDELQRDLITIQRSDY
jgi:hypothetical protein